MDPPCLPSRSEDGKEDGRNSGSKKSGRTCISTFAQCFGNCVGDRGYFGIGQELYHMEEGDIGFVFPNIIHHYQVFTDRENVAVFIKSPPFVLSTFDEVLLNYAPEYPIIKAADVDRETYRALGAVLKTKQTEFAIVQAYLQIVLARCIRNFELVEKRSIGSNDLIYQTVAYVSGNFKNPFSLEDMAKDLGVSKYVLSRIFSKTFHSNFKRYLNDTRLDYARHRLEDTEDSITKICLDSGFDSQRTFNRVFKERFRVSPTEYRKKSERESEAALMSYFYRKEIAG